MPEYNDALGILSQHMYRRALDELEHLFIQRLLELMKLGMNGVSTSLSVIDLSSASVLHFNILSGYKLHERIGKVLKTRAEAIRWALNAYNVAATQLNPP